jgi:hypothetical protein
LELPSFLNTVNSSLCGIQAPEILIQLANISSKMYHLYAVIQKQICHVHKFPPMWQFCQPSFAVLPVVSLQADTITAKFVIALQYIYLKSFIHQSSTCHVTYEDCHPGTTTKEFHFDYA